MGELRSGRLCVCVLSPCGDLGGFGFLAKRYDMIFYTSWFLMFVHISYGLYQFL